MNILTDAEKPHLFAVRDLQNLISENELTVRELQDTVLRLEKEIDRVEQAEKKGSNS